jgi:hypothetical protein
MGNVHGSSAQKNLPNTDATTTSLPFQPFFLLPRGLGQSQVIMDAANPAFRIICRLYAIVAHFQNSPFGVVPLLHSMSPLTLVYSKAIRVYIAVGYSVDFV